MEQLPAENSSEIPTRVDDLWFPKDSTIVIRAENKIFLVSGAILAARSTVFRDMLAFPQPTSGDTEQIDGSPVVRLHDSARDVEVFLRAIYDSSYFMPAPAPVDLWAYLYRRALEHLAEDWVVPAGNHLVTQPKSPINALSVITGATEVGALWLLPYANYCVSTYYTEQLLPFLEGDTEQIVRRALAAHAHILRGTIAVNRFLTMHDPCADCHRRALNPRWEWEDDKLESLKTEGMCDVCYELAKMRHDSAAVAFWDTLPSIFGLPPWTELRAMKQAAMGEEEENG
ncbi:hypothetical protein DFH09DRAFT_1125384, partial [Mycena vulgaris]